MLLQPQVGSQIKNSRSYTPKKAVKSHARQTTLSIRRSKDTGKQVLFVANKRLSGLRSRSNKNCKRCGALKRSRGVVCRACYFTMRAAAKIQITCEMCQKKLLVTFTEFNKRMKRTRHVYCSTLCFNQHYSILHRRRCRECGTVEGLARFGKICKECKEKERAENRMPPMICCVCSLEFRPKSHRTIFCGRKCANSFHSKRMTGKGNSHYKTGTSYAKWFRLMRPLILRETGTSVWVAGY